MVRDLKDLVDRVVRSGYQLSPESCEWLAGFSAGHTESIVDKAVLRAEKEPEGRLVLGLEFLKSVMGDDEEEGDRGVERGVAPLSEEVDPDIKEMGAEPSLPAGDVEGFIGYFRSRFKKLDDILRRRVDARDSITISRSRKMSLRSRFKVTGMVRDKRSSGERVFLDLDDMEDRITVLASDEEAVEKGLLIQEDQVICVEALKYKEDLLIAEDFIWPDIPVKKPGRSSEPVCAAFLSDLHVGSKFFREGLYHKFVDWLNRDLGNRRHRELASRVKYLIIAGDLVDGVGVYPDQLEELDITDIREQYKQASKLVQEIPDHIEVIIIPGNHDAVRRSIPQPVIPEEYAPLLHEDRRIHLYGNPCTIRLNGVEILVAHGKPLDDILSYTPGLSFNHPADGMEILLKTRHLAPSYGLTTPIAPEEKDRLVIETVPDVFLMGHIHIYDTKKHREATVICSGTFQDRTPYQTKMDLHPTTGVTSIFDLQTHQNNRLDLKQFT